MKTSTFLVVVFLFHPTFPVPHPTSMVNQQQRCAYYGCPFILETAGISYILLPVYLAHQGVGLAKNSVSYKTRIGSWCSLSAEERKVWKRAWLVRSGWPEESEGLERELQRRYSWSCLHHHEAIDWFASDDGKFKLRSGALPQAQLASPCDAISSASLFTPPPPNPVVRAALSSISLKRKANKCLSSPEKRLANVLGVVSTQCAVLEDTYENLDNSQKEINAYKADIAKLRRSNEQLQLQLITEQEAPRSEAVLESSQNIISPPTICYLRPSVKADSPVDMQEIGESETRLLEKVRCNMHYVKPLFYPSLLCEFAGLGSEVRFLLWEKRYSERKIFWT